LGTEASWDAFSASQVTLQPTSIYRLEEVSTVSWPNAPAGATLSFASDYTAQLNPQNEVAAVPEPPTVVGAGFGLAGLIAFRVWRRLKRG
jgi:hypothetical protein